MTDDEAREFFDAQARRLLKMSGADFVRAWEAGAYPDPDESPEVMEMVMLLPFAR